MDSLLGDICYKGVARSGIVALGRGNPPYSEVYFKFEIDQVLWVEIKCMASRLVIGGFWCKRVVRSGTVALWHWVEEIHHTRSSIS